jgi:GTP-binding protein
LPISAWTQARSANTSAGIGTARDLTLDDAIQYLGNDDLLEVTPVSLRIRKKILNHDVRQRTRRAQKA